MKKKLLRLFQLIAILSLWQNVGAQSFTPPSYTDDYENVATIEKYRQWAGYNVHDPSCIKYGDFYYLYSTDAIYWAKDAVRQVDSIKVGKIQVRRSRDLVNWEFVGWAFDSVPAEAVAHVRKYSGGHGATEIWAPYIVKTANGFRLYYSVSAFGANTSFIGVAEATTPLGPWTQKGCVVKTSQKDAMNAIDPTIATDAQNGKQWMIYGSYFGGIHCVELNKETGLTQTPNDLGKCIARRAGGDTAIIEAPEVIYNPSLKKYFLFVSYDPLFTTYNVRVGRADKPEGPYLDMYGKDMAETSDNYPVLTYSYRFQGHPGWSGVAHCGVLNDNGNYYMFHQGRIAPDNLMMTLHVRKIAWTASGWPVVSPERYAAVPQSSINKKEIEGDWEIIQLGEISNRVKLWQGQIPGGGWHYDTTRYNNSTLYTFLANGKVKGKSQWKWSLDKNVLTIVDAETKFTYSLSLFNDWDWERKTKTITFTGLGMNGYSLWGKKTSN